MTESELFRSDQESALQELLGDVEPSRPYRVLTERTEPQGVAASGASFSVGAFTSMSGPFTWHAIAGDPYTAEELTALGFPLPDPQEPS
jgi:hypothetical protein